MISPNASTIDPSPASISPRPDLEDDFSNPGCVIEILRQASAANLDSPLRRGSTIRLPASGRLLMTGDLHDHGVNLQRIIKLARLDESPDNHLVLHEIIHGDRQVNGADLSILTLARVAKLKLRYPSQVHFLQSNHELAQLGGEGIIKAGKNVVRLFDNGLDLIYESSADLVRNALEEYLRSLPLAIKCANGVFCSHSLPSSQGLGRFDPSVIDRVPTEKDLRHGGSVYELVWGRRHTQQVVDGLRQTWGVELFLLGHQPAEMGYWTQDDAMLVLASNHEHGVALPIDLATGYRLNDLVDRLVPLASVAP